MLDLFNAISKVSQTQYPVLIVGETGTRKELVARTIHQTGPLRREPFIPVDCAALVPSLVESELFGHIRGAFTGAESTREGLLKAARGGTVLLDEIGEMPVKLQPVLLRVLQEKEIRPVGSTRREKIYCQDHCCRQWRKATEYEAVKLSLEAIWLIKTIRWAGSVSLHPD